MGRSLITLSYTSNSIVRKRKGVAEGSRKGVSEVVGTVKWSGGRRRKTGRTGDGKVEGWTEELLGGPEIRLRGDGDAR